MPGFVDVSGWSKRDIQRLGHEDDDYQEPVRRTYKAQPQLTFTADTVWACAAAAHRINGEYLKEDQWQVTGQEEAKLQKQANKHMVKAWLRDQDYSQLTAADYDAGREYRRHFTSYTMLAMAGGLNDFQQQAFKIACMESFTGRNMLEFAIVSCLPSVAERDRVRTEIKREVYSSTQLRGEIGEAVIGDLVVVTSRYSKEYNKYRITGRMGEAFVDFWFAADLNKDETYRIKGKIKNVREDKTTQLNFVKKIG